MGIYYIEGIINRNDTFEKFCGQHSIDPKKAVFLFPGNNTHHGSKHTLYSIKRGAGLAIPAGNLGAAGYPVLSLPTTGMQSYENNQEIKSIVHGALADLWRAIGAGYHLVLPVRTHANKTYFDSPLANTQQLEPSFWGGVQFHPNKSLGNYYIKELNRIAYYFTLSPEEIAAYLDNLKTEDNSFYTAFMDGKSMTATAAWLRSKDSAGSTNHNLINDQSDKDQSDKDQSDNAGLWIILGGGLLAISGGSTIVVGALALASIISVSFSPVVLIVGGAGSLTVGLFTLFSGRSEGVRGCSEPVLMSQELS